MAYNYLPTYQPMYQPVQYQPQVQIQSARIWVSSLNEAQMYPVAPNNSVDLWDSTAPVIYSKQADASGRPSMKIYDITERVEAAQSASTGNAEYVTKSDYVALNKAVEGIRADIETIKGDVYGIAGKRKKREDEE